MENKIIVSLLFLMTLMTIGFASAATTLVAPADSGTSIDDTLLNVTHSSTASKNFTCNIYAKSASTANSSWSIIASIVNITVAEASSKVNLSKVLEDSNNYVFNATCVNISGVIGEDTNIGITLDNTDPTTPASLVPASGTKDTDGSVAFSAAVTGSKTTGCTLYFVGKNPGQSGYTMTHSGDTCTHTLAGISEESYKYYIQASDGTDTANSATANLVVDISSGGAKGAAILLQTQQGQTRTLASGLSSEVLGIPIWVVLIGIVVLIVLVLLKRK